MEPYYLLEYLKNNSFFTQTRYDNIRYEFDNHLHYYGGQYKYPHEYPRNKIESLIRIYIKKLLILYQIFPKKKPKSIFEPILSNAYFTVNEELKNLGYQVFRPFWHMANEKNVLNNIDLFLRSERIKFKFKNSNFNELIKEDFIKEINMMEVELNLHFQKNNVKALFVPNDVSFFENLSLQVCKRLDIPTFIFLHGLPARYNQIDEHRSDYLIVWGDKIKENYIKAGMNPNKIFVSGHPYYKKFEFSHLNHSLENVLVLTKSIVGAHHSDGVVLGDRANLILYLYSVEKVLKILGIKSARFRPHPSENQKWYLKFINKEFYRFDDKNLKQSILSSSLIIGPTSTVFLESLYYGVNYVVYEPSINNIDLTNCQLVNPFDGTDFKIPVAKNEDELEYILKNKINVDSTCFHDFISTPFDLSFVKKLI